MRQPVRTLGLILAGWLLVSGVTQAQTQTIQEALEQILQLKKQLALEKARADELAAEARAQADQARRAEQEARRQAEIALQAAKEAEARAIAAREAEARARQQQQQNQGPPQPVPNEVDRLRRELEETRRALEESRREAEKLADRLRQVEIERVRGVDGANRELVERLMQLERRMMEMERRMRLQPGIPLERPRVKPAENPEGPSIEGEVTRVEKNLLSLSVGADVGLQKGTTLELFRLGGKPLYLGQVRVVEVQPKSAVATVVGRLNEDAKPGDRVATLVNK